MSIASNLRRAGPFATNGVQTVFAFEFKVFTTTDVKVVSTLDGAETVLVLTTNYTVALNPDQEADPGGSITLLVAPNGPTITLIGQLGYAQPTVFTNTGGFFPTVLNNALDRVTILAQQLYELVARAPLRPVDASDYEGYLPQIDVNGEWALVGDAAFTGPTGPEGSPDGSFVTPEMFGAVAGEANSQPAWAAALAFAAANGIRSVRPKTAGATYNLRQPNRTSATSDIWATDGIHLTITSSVEIDFRGATLNFYGPTGGAIDADFQTVSGNPWRSPSVAIIGGASGGAPTSFNVGPVVLRNGTFYGQSIGRPIGPSAGDEHKGLRIQDTMCGRLHLENMKMYNYRGEILYLGNSNHMPITLLNCEAMNAGQCALNPNRGQVTVIGGRYGNSYLACETVGGTGQTFLGVTFVDADQVTFMGGGMYNGAQNGLYFIPSDPGDEDELPWITLRGCAFLDVAQLNMANYITGDILVQDGQVNFTYTFGRQKSNRLRIHSVTHKRASTAALYIQGPPTLTTAIAGASPAFNAEPIRNSAFELSMSRTPYAVTNSILAARAVRMGGYIKQETVEVTLDPSCIGCTQTFAAIVDVFGTVKGMARISLAEMPAEYGLIYAASAGAMTLSPVSPIMALQWTGAAATKDIGVANPLDTANGYTFPPWQRLRVFYEGSTTAGTVFRFDPATWRTPEDIKLRTYGDWIEFEWNPYTLGTGAWQYVNHYSKDEVLYGSATYDPANLVDGAGATTTIAVTGCAMGDFVSASFSLDLQGITLTAWVSVAGTVSIRFQNESGGALDLASGTLRVVVRKA